MNSIKVKIMKQKLTKTFFLVIVSLTFVWSVNAQTNEKELMDAIASIKKSFESYRHKTDALQKKIDDIYWYNKVGDVAYVDKVYMTGPPLAK